MRSDRNVHTYPTWEPHETSGLDCHCSPRYLVSHDDPDRNEYVDRTAAEFEVKPIVIVHNAITPQHAPRGILA